MNQLPLSKKFAYSMGGFALNIANLAISQWLMKLYVPSLDTALISPFLFSLIFLLGRVTDGITEPLVGYISDNFRSKRGRRMPFIIGAVVPVALVSFLLWVPPFPNQYHWINGVYIFVMVQLFFILWSTLANPYMSLLPEITTDLKERVNISTMQAGFIMLGTLVFGAMGPVKEAFGFKGIGVVVFAATIIAFLPTIIFVKQKPSNAETVSKEKFRLLNIFSWARTTFKNKPFVHLLMATSLYWFALNMVILLIPFWSENILHITDDKVIFLMIPILAANIIFFFVFNVCAHRFGKYITFLVVLGGSAVAMPLLALVGVFQIGTAMFETQCVLAIFGIFMSGFLMLPMALFADVVDYDEKLTGFRREGIYFGVQSIFQKISIGFSVALAGTLMYAGGQNKPTEFGLKGIALAAGICAVLAFIAFLRYPLRDKNGVISERK